MTPTEVLVAMFVAMLTVILAASVAHVGAAVIRKS